MLRLNNIQVHYSYKRVLTGITLEFEKGKIYSLLGENGAGKSTLAHVLCGDILPSGGSIYLNQKKLNIKNPKDAIRNGIVCVHQRPLLAPSLSIRDNLRIGISHEMTKKIPELAQNWLPGRELSEKVAQLSEQEIFNTSLTGALLKNPCLLILDEAPFLDKNKIRQLAQEGLIIIIITHSFKEAIEKSDEVILLKDGSVLEKREASSVTEAYIREKLFGLTKVITRPDFIEEKEISEEEVLRLRDKISGSSPKMTSQSSPKMTRLSSPKMTENKIGYIPSDRSFRASNPELTILQLCTAYHTNLKQKELEKYAQTLLKKAEVNIRLYEKASCLSGGMLQRLILERELAENPEELYLFDPLHGLDAEAIERLYDRLEGLAKKGVKVIIGKEK